MYFWFYSDLIRTKPDTLFSMSKYCICRNDINFPNSKLGFSLHATETEYKKLDFHMLNTLCSSYSSIKEWMGMPERCLRTEKHGIECVSVRVLLAYPYRTFLLLLYRRLEVWLHMKIQFFVSGSLQKKEKPQTTNLGKYISCKCNIRHAQKCFRFALIKSERKSEYKISGTSHKYFYIHIYKQRQNSDVKVWTLHNIKKKPDTFLCSDSFLHVEYIKVILHFRYLSCFSSAVYIIWFYSFIL